MDHVPHAAPVGQAPAVVAVLLAVFSFVPEPLT